MAIETTYCSIAEVDSFAVDNGRPEWSSLSDTVKTKSIVDATRDIEKYHKQFSSNGDLWDETDTNLNKGCIYQSLYVGRIRSHRDVAEKIDGISSGSYNAGGLVVRGGAPRRLDPDALLFVDRYLTINGYRQNAFFRA